MNTEFLFRKIDGKSLCYIRNIMDVTSALTTVEFHNYQKIYVCHHVYLPEFMGTCRTWLY